MKFALIAITALLFCSYEVKSQDCGCNGLLKYEVSSRQSIEQVQLYFLQSVNEANYSEKKNSLSGSATIPIEGIPVDFSGNWEKFEKSRRDFFLNIQYSQNSFTSENEYQQKMNNLGLSLFNDCVALCSGKEGIYIKPTQNLCDYSNAIIKSIISASESVNIKIALQNGSINNKTEFESYVFRNGSEFPLTISRINKSSPITGTLQATNGYSKSFSIPVICNKVTCNNRGWALAYLDYDAKKSKQRTINDIFDNYTRIYADINKDGNIDVIHMSNRMAFINYSDKFCSSTIDSRTSLKFSDDELYDKFNRSVEDKNGDGNMDIVYTRPDGSLTFYYRGDGRGNFNLERKCCASSNSEYFNECGSCK